MMRWRMLASERGRLAIRGIGRVGLSGCVMIALVSGAGRVGVHAADVPQTSSAKQLVQKMLTVEDGEELRKGRYAYLSKERSERTGGHLWTERVAETSAGKLRRLIAEDGQTLTGERAAAEESRLAAIAADPEGFRKKSEALKNDEKHAKAMLDLLP